MNPGQRVKGWKAQNNPVSYGAPPPPKKSGRIRFDHRYKTAIRSNDIILKQLNTNLGKNKDRISSFQLNHNIALMPESN